MQRRRMAVAVMVVEAITVEDSNHSPEEEAVVQKEDGGHAEEDGMR